MKRKLSDKDCDAIKGIVKKARWDGWTLAYIQETADDFNVSPSTIHNVIFNKGAYRDLPSPPLCRNRMCVFADCDIHARKPVETA